MEGREEDECPLECLQKQPLERIGRESMAGRTGTFLNHVASRSNSLSLPVKAVSLSRPSPSLDTYRSSAYIVLWFIKATVAAASLICQPSTW